MPGFTVQAEPFEYSLADDIRLEDELDQEISQAQTGANDLRWVQQALNQILGLRLAVDGKMGPATRSAIRAFQHKRGLAVDGIAGPKTVAALRAEVDSPPQAAPGRGGGDCQVLDDFDFNRDTLKPAHDAQLKAIAQRIIASQRTAQPVRSARLTGHTDPVGSAAYNVQLGRKRAEQVSARLRQALEQLKPGSSQTITLTVDSKGESQQVPGGPARNRRVEICLERGRRPTGGDKPPAPKTDGKRWFDTVNMPPVRAGNLVTPFIDGRTTFAAMVQAMRTATTSEHYIYLLGWHMSDDFEMAPGDHDSTVRALFANASRRGVQVRAMLWDQWGRQNSAEVSRINGLANGAAILDNRTLNFGSHHQKILVVKGGEGLIGFCGGIDINPDRIRRVGGSGSSSAGNGSPLHDVHCRIMGPAAHDLLRIFRERWDDHPDHTTLDRTKGALRGAGERVPAAAGNMSVQVARTYGNGTRHAGIGRGGYRFAPRGERTIWCQVLRAIEQARKFIYIEDQYLVSMEASRALQAALPNIQHLTILIPHGSITDMPQVNFRRQQFIAPLRAAGGSKVRVFFLSPAGAANTYVHAKTWMIDDEYAIIGSANCNRRGYTHDSEVTAGIFDPAGRALAKQLRVALWARHLNLDTASGRRALEDGVASARFWLSPPSGARIAPYNENADIERLHSNATWNQVIDPDGS